MTSAFGSGRWSVELRQRRLTLLVLVLPCGIAWAAAGCADDSTAAPPDELDGGDAAVTDAGSLLDSGDDAGNKRDCSKDLDADGIYKHLECSGLYSSWPPRSEKAVASDVRAYKPGVEFWSDGAEKHRWIYLPPGSKIDISDWNEWMFPAGTKLWKELKLGGKRIETRLFTKLPDNSWAHTAYRWNADETDAVRKDGGESIKGIGPDGGAYEIPSTGECDQCHTGRKDQVLGFDAVSLGLATATGQTLAKLVEDGMLSQAPPATTLAFPGAAAAQSAIGWVHANCGSCHNDNTNASATFRKHFLVRATELAPVDGGSPAAVEQLNLWKEAYCVDTFRTDPETLAPFVYIRGGTPAKSLMSVLAHGRVGPDELPNSGAQMPPIVSRAVDHQGVKLFDDWIATLPPCR